MPRKRSSADASAKLAARQKLPGDADAPKRGPGRPGVPHAQRDAFVEAVCKHIAEGALIINACKAVGVEHAAFRVWSTLPQYATIYARAREEAADMLADEALDVARGSTNETAQADRLRVDTLKWAAAKRRPRVYGDKVDVTSDNKPLAATQTIIIGDRRVEF